MSYKIEKDWITTSGLRAVVIASEFPVAYSCGYVALPLDSTLHNLDLSRLIDCHGGITFQGKSTASAYLAHSDNWWVGFACVPYGDSPEIQNLEFCTDQCEWIASQLTQLEKQHNG